jgi:AraC-like DNA-binding protein
MRRPKDGPAVGLLRPLTEGEVRLTRYLPSEELAPFVDYYWIVRWSITNGPRRQETLPHPCIHLVVERGASGVFGIVRGRFTKDIDGSGRAVSIRFRPGGFSAFWPHPVNRLTGRVLTLRDAFGDVGSGYENAVLGAPDDDDALVSIAEDFLRRFDPRTDDAIALVTRAAEIVARDSSLMRVDDLATMVGISVRALQRLFGQRVGVSPKWMIDRARLQDAAARVMAGERVDWSRLALDLGYYDQSHLIRAYTAVIGLSPTAHQRRVADSRGRSHTPSRIRQT